MRYATGPRVSFSIITGSCVYSCAPTSSATKIRFKGSAGGGCTGGQPPTGENFMIANQDSAPGEAPIVDQVGSWRASCSRARGWIGHPGEKLRLKTPRCNTLRSSMIRGHGPVHALTVGCPPGRRRLDDTPDP